MEFSPNWHRIKMRPRKFVRALAIFLVLNANAGENARKVET
jgi:hypothetical protein